MISAPWYKSVQELDYLDEDTWGTVFRDVILLALIGFVAMVIMLLPHITTAKKKAEEQIAPGNVIVEIHWPADLPVDVDLWVQAPRELPVGFWNLGGHTFNLLRDDLGSEGTPRTRTTRSPTAAASLRANTSSTCTCTGLRRQIPPCP